MASVGAKHTVVCRPMCRENTWIRIPTLMQGGTQLCSLQLWGIFTHIQSKTTDKHSLNTEHGGAATPQSLPERGHSKQVFSG